MIRLLKKISYPITYSRKIQKTCYRNCHIPKQRFRRTFWDAYSINSRFPTHLRHHKFGLFVILDPSRMLCLPTVWQLGNFSIYWLLFGSHLIKLFTFGSFFVFLLLTLRHSECLHICEYWFFWVDFLSYSSCKRSLLVFLSMHESLAYIFVRNLGFEFNECAQWSEEACIYFI